MSADLETTAREVVQAWLVNDDATPADLEAEIVRVAHEHAERENATLQDTLAASRAREERALARSVEAEGSAAGAVSLLRRLVAEPPSERAMRAAQIDARGVLKTRDAALQKR